MTRRRPPDARLAAARYAVEHAAPPVDDDAGEAIDPGQPTLDQQGQMVEIAIQQAMRRGDFADLPGAGKPLFNNNHGYNWDTSSRDGELWIGQLTDGSWIVALFNRGDEPKKTPREKAPTPEYLAHAAESLADNLDTKVSVSMGKRKGKIVVEFGGREDFERIMGLLQG